MAAFNIVTWNTTKNANQNKVSSANTFDFASIRIGADNLEMSQSGSGGSAAFNFNNRKLEGLADATVNTGAATLGQMNAAISLAVLTGGSLKEAVLVQEQLSAVQGILAGSIFYATAAAVDGDTVVLHDGTSAETFTFASTNAAFQPAFGVNAAASMQNLATRINTDSTSFSAKWIPSMLASVNPGGCVVVYEKTAVGGISPSRIYGTWATQADAKVVQFNGQAEYKTGQTPVTLPSADPAAGRFGFRRVLASLTNGEIHYVHETDVMQSWDDDSNAWTTFQNGSVPDGTSASGGGVKGKLTLDSDYGLQATAGVARIVTDNQGLGFSAGNLVIALDGGTLSKSGSGLKVADAGITETQLATSVAGDGLSGGAGSALAVGAGDGIKVSTNAVSTDYANGFTNDNAGAITIRQVAYVKSNGNVDLAIADSSIATLAKAKIVVVEQASIASAASGSCYARQGAKITGFSGLTPGLVYLSKTVAGAVTQDTSGFTTGDHILSIGEAISATEVIFNPKHIIEL